MRWQSMKRLRSMLLWQSRDGEQYVTANSEP